ncbi:MAG TPA: hypothetical protein EYP89_03055 [Candidatus Omnitrophica bacterium]|nr:hypothetical protein [Candidatus Omnitrophota bacterium]
MESKPKYQESLSLDEFGISVIKEGDAKKLIDPFSESPFIIVSQDSDQSLLPKPISKSIKQKSIKQTIYVI